jgi:hypothetical protein
MSASTAREDQAERLDRIVAEAQRLADHARVAAGHFRAQDIPRAAAHSLALAGHLANIRALFDDVASAHASKAEP